MSILITKSVLVTRFNLYEHITHGTQKYILYDVLLLNLIIKIIKTTITI